MMIHFDVLNRFTGEVQFTAEIDCEDDEAISVKLGLAVRWAVKTGANLRATDLQFADLRGENLRGTDMRYADFSGADIRWADFSRAELAMATGLGDYIIEGGLRSDGYCFHLLRNKPGEFRVNAGCRNFAVSEARRHWNTARPKGDPLGDETRLIIKHMLAVAKLRGWKPWTEKDQ